MLCRLEIRDFVLVHALALDFQPGFGALTGETGAGKSLLIDALAFVLGERAEAGLIRSGASRAEVTAEFDASVDPAFVAWFAEQAIPLEAGEGVLIRRVLEAAGRSRAFINGVPVTLQQVRTAGEWLLDIHGQHAHQSLLRADAQRQLLDDFGQLQTQARTVALAWREWVAARQALADAGKRSGEIVARRETLASERGNVPGLRLIGLAPCVQPGHPAPTQGVGRGVAIQQVTVKEICPKAPRQPQGEDPD